MYFLVYLCLVERVGEGGRRKGGMRGGRVGRERKLRGVGPSVGPCLMTQPPHTVIPFSQEFCAVQELL